MQLISKVVHATLCVSSSLFNDIMAKFADVPNLCFYRDLGTGFSGKDTLGKTRILKFTLRTTLRHITFNVSVNLGKKYNFTEVYFDKEIKL